jgi:hypothetical protein
VREMADKKIVFITIVDGTPTDYSFLTQTLRQISRTSNYEFIMGKKEITSINYDQLVNLVENLKEEVKNDNDTNGRTDEQRPQTPNTES